MILVAAALAGPLHDAVRAGRADEVQRLLAQGADANEHVVLESSSVSGMWIFQKTTTTRLETTALHLAIEAGEIDIARRLLDAGADPDAVTRHRLPVLHHLAMAPDARHLDAAVGLLLEHGAQPEGRFRGRTALSALPDAGGEGFVRALVAHGASPAVLVCDAVARDLDLLGELGATASEACGTATLVHRAVQRQSRVALDWVLAHGGDPSAPGVVDGVELAPLHLAVASGWTEGVDVLLAHGAPPNQRVGLMGPTPWGVVSDPVIARMLAEAGTLRTSAFDDAAVWTAAPIRPPEVAAYLASWAGGVPPVGAFGALSDDLRPVYQERVGQASEWSGMASALTADQVLQALTYEAEPCGFPDPDGLITSHGPPTSSQRLGPYRWMRWEGREALIAGDTIRELRGACTDADIQLVGRSRAFVWLALGPPQRGGRRSELRAGGHVVWLDGDQVTQVGRSW